MKDVEELERALAFPWEKWTTFLHPAQRQWVEREYAGPARIAGSAGTGKTIVALHRAVFLARRSEEHTSELQSLMRISYAVFCLKKKNKKQCNINKQEQHDPSKCGLI